MLYAAIGMGSMAPVGVLSDAEHVTSLIVLFAYTAVGAFAAARLQRAHGPQRLRTSDPLAPEPQGNVQRSRLNSGEAG